MTELFLWAFARKPTKDDMAPRCDHIKKLEAKQRAAGKKTAYENILWAAAQHEGVRVQPVVFE